MQRQANAGPIFIYRRRAVAQGEGDLWFAALHCEWRTTRLKHDVRQYVLAGLALQVQVLLLRLLQGAAAAAAAGDNRCRRLPIACSMHIAGCTSGAGALECYRGDWTTSPSNGHNKRTGRQLDGAASALIAVLCWDAGIIAVA